jgi:predicted ATPase
MEILFPHAIVITGGPCCGKTTIIDGVTALGYKALPEVARIVIDESKRSGSDLVPWLRLFDFQQEVARRMLVQEEVLSERQEPFFLDRGLIDGIGYCREGGIKVPEVLLKHSLNRYGKVIVLEPLPYKKDDCRIEDPERAAKIHTYILHAYLDHGYQPISLPVLPPEERVDRLLELVLS